MVLTFPVPSRGPWFYARRSVYCSNRINKELKHLGCNKGEWGRVSNNYFNADFELAPLVDS
jgi:hypothetical protein